MHVIYDVLIYVPEHTNIQVLVIKLMKIIEGNK